MQECKHIFTVYAAGMQQQSVYASTTYEAIEKVFDRSQQPDRSKYTAVKRR